MTHVLRECIQDLMPGGMSFGCKSASRARCLERMREKILVFSSWLRGRGKEGDMYVISRPVDLKKKYSSSVFIGPIFSSA